MTTYKSMVDACMKMSGADACNCWSNASFSTYATKVRACKLSDASKAVVKQLGYCRSNFSTCKQFEDESLKAIAACSTPTSKLLVRAKALTSNKAGLESVKTTAATLAGNSSSKANFAISRAAATSCAEVIEKIAQILKYVEQNPASSKISTTAKEVNVTVTCTSDEKTSLSNQGSNIDAAITTVTETLSTIQDSLETVSGTTASSSVIAAVTESSSASTAASSGRRNIVARHLMNRLNLH